MFKELNINKKSVKDGIDTQAMEFKPLKEFAGQELKVDGFFFTNSSEYGKQVVVVSKGYKINMPKRAVEQFEEIYRKDKLLNAVLEGHLKITGIAELQAKNGMTTKYELEDC